MAETALHPRPSMHTILRSDNNAQGNFMELIEYHRALRHTKFPSIKGPGGHYDFPSFQARYKDSPAFIKWNKHAVAPHYGYSLAPHRDNHPIIDPASGFISAGADKDLETNVKNIPSMAQSSDKIQHGTPSTKPPDSARPQTPPSDPLYDEMTPQDREGLWSARKVTDIKLRAECGGWTTDEKAIPKPSKEHSNLAVGTFNFSDESWRDKAAKKYMFTSGTQSSFDYVNWDSKLPPKIKPRPSTMEKMADPISQRFTDWMKRYRPTSEQCQRLGRSWDWFQARNGYLRSKDVDYTSHYRQSGHIPNYGGSVGADNFEDKDNPEAEYNPFTRLRTPLPWYTETAKRPNIPGYAGSTHWVGIHPAHSQFPAPEPPSTAYVHRPMPTPPNTSPWAKRAPMSRMVTTVPPKNPFNTIDDISVA
uniref:spermatogenesis-associated protein 48-like n=1 Tax=Styela clava TaxID=7725 RepID=UPI00193A2880|nr:spermatogenesis-associated protein 48-like [Styela clava]